MNNLQNKVIWLTGASSGIGKALTEKLQQNNIRLIISARRTEKLEELSHNKNNITILPLDLTDAEARKKAVDTAISVYGHIDMVIFNAGLSQRTLAAETSLENTRMIMETNFFSSVDIATLLLPHMKQNNGGQFIIISSIMGKFGAQRRSVYAASKHALHGYFESLRAEEWHNNIRVTFAIPGYINTDISRHALAEHGTNHGKLDAGQASGMSAEKCAEIIIKNILNGTEEFLVGGKEIYSTFLKRFCPKLLSKILRNKNIS